MKLNIFSIPIYIGNIETDKIQISNKGFEKTWLSKTESSHNYVNEIEESSWAYLQKIIVDLLKEDFNYTYELTLKSIWKMNIRKMIFKKTIYILGLIFRLLFTEK